MFSIHSSIVDTVVDVQWLMSRCSFFKILLEPGKLGTAAHSWAPHEIVQDRVPQGGSIFGTWVIVSRTMTAGVDEVVNVSVSQDILETLMTNSDLF